MAREVNKLSARGVSALTKPGRHGDGAGLWLIVEKSGAKRWAFLFRQGGRLREMGLGGLNAVPLKLARELAAECRELLAKGRDPIADRQAAPTLAPTFGDFADQFVKDKSPGWRNEKHRAQWKMTLEVYAAPIRKKTLDAISTEDVLDVLKRVWVEKPETASRLRGRIEAILDAARVAGHRQGENPARWKGHLDHLLPKRSKLSRGHHAAMPYADVPAFVAELRGKESIGFLALEFLILTAARSSEAIGARWDEIDETEKLWIVPRERMKSGREHRVPLSSRALAILAEAAKVRTNSAFVFPGQRPKRPLSNMALEMAMRRMGRESLTVHGFRSSFRDWAGDATSFPREVAEAALAHATGDETEQAYRRSDALAKRRKLMDAWASYCEAKGAANVVMLKKRGAAKSAR